MLTLLKDLDAHRDLLRIMVARNIKIRYRRSALGFLWTLLNPLFFILIYAVFLKILRFYKGHDPLFLPMLVTGVITWHFLALCLGDSLHAVLGHANLVAKTAFPRIILPLSMAFANLVNLLLSLAILLGYVLVLRLGGWAPVSFEYIGILPATVLTQFALCLGLSLLLSALNVFFRDTEHVLSVALLAWFFLTPVIYYLSDVPEAYQRLAFLNPMTGIITAYRAACLGTGIMAPRLVMVSFAMAWAVCALGFAVFQRLQRRFVEEL